MSNTKKTHPPPVWTQETVTKSINDLFNEFDMTVISGGEFDMTVINDKNIGKSILRYFFREEKKFIDENEDIEEIEFNIYFQDSKPDYIYINYFKSFHNGKQIISGTKLLNKFKKLGKILGVKSIELYDTSHKQFNICNRSFDLSILEILTEKTAQSWYNKNDFVSDNHMENVEHNEKQRNRLFKNIIEEMKQKMKSKDAKLLDNYVTTLCSLVSS